MQKNPRKTMKINPKFQIEQDVVLRNGLPSVVLEIIIRQNMTLLYSVGYWAGDDYKCALFYDFELNTVNNQIGFKKE